MRFDFGSKLSQDKLGGFQKSRNDIVIACLKVVSNIALAHRQLKWSVSACVLEKNVFKENAFQFMSSMGRLPVMFYAAHGFLQSPKCSTATMRNVKQWRSTTRLQGKLQQISGPGEHSGSEEAGVRQWHPKCPLPGPDFCQQCGSHLLGRRAKHVEVPSQGLHRRPWTTALTSD